MFSRSSPLPLKVDYDSAANAHGGNSDLVLALGCFTREIIKTADNKSPRRDDSIAPSTSNAERPTATFRGPSVIYDAHGVAQEQPSMVSEHSSTPSAAAASHGVGEDVYQVHKLTLHYLNCPQSFEDEFGVFLTLDRSVPLIATILEMIFILVNGAAKFMQGSKMSPNSALYASFGAAIIPPLVFYWFKRRQEKLLRQYRRLSLESDADPNNNSAAADFNNDAASNFAGALPLFSFHDLYSSSASEVRGALRQNALHHEIVAVLSYFFFALVEVAVRFEYPRCGLTLTPLDRRNYCENTIGSQSAFMSFLVINTATVPARFPFFVLYSVGLFGFLIGCRWLPGTIPPELPTQVASSITLLGVVLLFCIGTVYLQERMARQSFLSFAALLSKIDEASVVKKKVGTIASSVSSFDLTAHVSLTASAAGGSDGSSPPRVCVAVLIGDARCQRRLFSHVRYGSLCTHCPCGPRIPLTQNALCVRRGEDAAH